MRLEFLASLDVLDSDTLVSVLRIGALSRAIQFARCGLVRLASEAIGVDTRTRSPMSPEELVAWCGMVGRLNPKPDGSDLSAVREQVIASLDSLRPSREVHQAPGIGM